MAAIPKLRLLILCGGDPNSEVVFSGSARALFQALERRGCVVHKENVLGFSDPFKKLNFVGKVIQKLDRFRLWENYRLSPLCFSRNTKRALDVVRSRSDYNACLMYGTRFNPTLDVPKYCYLDATAAQLVAANGWGFAGRSKSNNQKNIDYQRRVFDSCSGVFPRTQFAADSVYHDYSISKEKVTVAGAGYNHNKPPLAHQSYESKNILFVGVQFERKGGPLILDAFKIVRDKIPEATLTIVGARLDINEPGVEVVERIYKDESDGLNRILEFYSKASLFCIMSTLEPFGIVVIEAQNSFVPCIVPKKFAFTETVSDGITGVHLSNETPEALAKVMVELLNNPEKLKRMGEAAHNYVQENWTWDIAAERIERRILKDLNLDVGVESRVLGNRKSAI